MADPMPDPMPDFDPATHGQVAMLLGAQRAEEMLGLLRGTMATLSRMSQAELASPDGLSLVHRLKSEAGLMGFGRLSRACAVVDAARAGGAVPRAALGELGAAIGWALRLADALQERRPCPAP